MSQHKNRNYLLSTSIDFLFQRPFFEIINPYAGLSLVANYFILNGYENTMKCGMDLFIGAVYEINEQFKFLGEFEYYIKI
jgi:hypothetical protein